MMDSGDERMRDADQEPIGSLWIRRQVFEHSVAVPLLTSTTASQIDFQRLAAELASASVYMDSDTPPAVTYDDWITAAGLHARLDSSDDACVIIEALETNAPEAFVRCNDPEKLAPGRQLNYRQLLIPVPELVAFLRLHAAATIASRFRETADAVWPEADTSSSSSSVHSASPTQSTPTGTRPTLSAIPLSMLATSSSPGVGPMSPRVAQLGQMASSSPISTRLSASSPVALSPASPVHSGPSGMPPGSPSGHSQTSASTGSGLDSLVRKKTPTHLGHMLGSQSAILASAQNSLQRETNLVASNIGSLLATVAATYGILPEGSIDHRSSDDGSTSSGSGATPVESGTLSRSGSEARSRRGPLVDSAEISGNGVVSKSARNKLPISRAIFEHLSFLLTTTLSPSGSRRSISWVVPQWRDESSTATVQLGALVEIVRTALTRVVPPDEPLGAIDIVEFCDMDRKTYLRSSLPPCNSDSTSYPHGREIVGDNRGLIFAPYNAAYPDAMKDMAEVGVSPTCNMWDQFYRPAYRSDGTRGSQDPDLTPAVASALPPEKFLPFSVPAKTLSISTSKESVAGNSKSAEESPSSSGREVTSRGLFTVPLALPAEYAAELAARRHEIDIIRKEIRNVEATSLSLATSVSRSFSDVKDVPMSDATPSAGMRNVPSEGSSQVSASGSMGNRGLLQAIVQEKFREWLNATGNMRQIHDLVRIEQEMNDAKAQTLDRKVH